MPTEASIRPVRQTPRTNQDIDRSKINAEVAHEESLRYYLENSELGVLTPEQMSIIALIDSVEDIGIDLPATRHLFERQRQLSSGEAGKARIQCKEIITAGQFPMSLLFGEEKPGYLDRLKRFFGGAPAEPKQKTM